MKVRFFILISLFILLTACQITTDNENYSLKYNPGTDAQIEYMYQGMSQQFTAVNDGYYFINDYYLYYMDRKSMKPVILDSNPRSDCLATSNIPENCNAFVFKAGGTKFLSQYNNHLYTLQQSVDLKSKLFEFDTYQLAQLSLDGQTRKVVLEFEVEPTSISIHRGFLYVALNKSLDDGQNRYQLLRYNMEKLSQEPQLLFEGSETNGRIMDIYPYGKYIYFFEGKGIDLNYRSYDLEKKQLNTMFVAEDDPHTGYIMGIHNNEIVYTLYKDSITDTEAWQARVSSLTSDEKVVLPLEPQALSYYYQSPTDDKLYMMPVWGYQEYEPELYESVSQGITIFDRSYKQVDYVEMPFLESNTVVFSGDQDYMFVKSEENDDNIWYILDKSTIGSGKATFHELVRTPSTSPSIYYDHE